MRTRASYLLLSAVLLLFGTALFLYSQTKAFAWDEGFHLLAAQLIRRGKSPYIDFVFSQTPLNAYWNAGWMGVLGESWRAIHGVAAVCLACAVALTAYFVFFRFPVSQWRLAGAIVAALLMGFNVAVFQYGTVGQAYGLCMLAIVVAFIFSVRSVDRSSAVNAAWPGLFAGIAAASSLLTAPVGLVLLVWILFYNRAGNRWTKLIAFMVAEAIPFAPLAWLFARGPRQVFFGIIEYNFKYRLLDWPGATRHNLEAYASFIDSGPALLLGLLAVGGWLFIYYQADWSAAQKREFYLCGWLAVALTAHISYAKPTFARYYLFTVPFLAVLAIAGLYGATSRLYNGGRPWAPSLIVTVLLLIGVAKYVDGARDDLDNNDIQKVADKVNEVTPPGQPFMADEMVYFLMRREPPSGMELRDSHKLDLSPDQEKLFHLISKAELARRVKAGDYSTAETCDTDDVKRLDLEKAYAKRMDFEDNDCSVFWDRKAIPGK